MDTEDHLCFPQLLNISCQKPSLEFHLHSVPLSVMAVIIVVLNLLVIVSISHFRQLHTPTNLLLLSLAIADYLLGFQIIPGQIYMMTSCWFLGDLLCSYFMFSLLTVTSASVGNMVLISIDRYVAISDPLHYNIKVTVKRIRLCIGLCWCLSLSYAGTIFNNQQTQGKYYSCYGECIFTMDFNTGVADVWVTFILPLSIIITLYTRVFVVAVSQARAMRSHVRCGKLKQSVPLRAKKSELKAARTLGILVVIFLLCFCPYYTISLVPHFDEFYLYAVYLYCLNSCVNPLIYALFYPWFRRAVKHIVTLSILRSGSCDANLL
ncbi:trace amine-associated receptor 6-like [Syngnathus typhle]|uniref:trace amine-associated receptor 6-like n=1 Tax=Syngnathus typhle TaxID=161592 RepID=UPI002A69CBFE|nr:trace amine-associated receptor 6-like [Syngnathus typhle]